MSTVTGIAGAIMLVSAMSLGAAGEFEEAMVAYKHGHYAAARVKLTLVAEKGDARAQEILGIMYALGPRVYPGVPRQMRSAALWLDRAARSGRPTARYLFCALARSEFKVDPTAWNCADRVTEDS